VIKMIKITKSGMIRVVTNGAYESMYKNNGWIIMDVELKESVDVVPDKESGDSAVDEGFVIEVGKELEDDELEGEELEVDEIPLDQMNAEQLIKYAKELGIETPPGTTRKMLRTAIKEKINN